jgi:hypothetical protein
MKLKKFVMMNVQNVKWNYKHFEKKFEKNFLKIIDFIVCFYLFKLETLYKSKQDTLNEKEMRIGDRFKTELDV